jgi:uncharacterized membrane protein YphA (DoxX/SURF4 family)
MIRKFLFSNDLGVGRFVKIGIPVPPVMAPFVAVIEIVCESLILLGLLTRLVAIVLIIDMCVALISTKIQILLGHGFWRFSVSKLPSYGFLSITHEARTDSRHVVRFDFSSDSRDKAPGRWMRG